jgi:hypothetical protein
MRLLTTVMCCLACPGAAEHPLHRSIRSWKTAFLPFARARKTHLQRVPGPKAILSYLARDADLLERALPLPRLTRTIWKVLRRHGCIVRPVHLPPEPMERPAPMSAWQIDLKDASTVPADPDGKRKPSGGNLERRGYGHLHRPLVLGARPFSCADGEALHGQHPARAGKARLDHL